MIFNISRHKDAKNKEFGGFHRYETRQFLSDYFTTNFLPPLM